MKTIVKNELNAFLDKLRGLGVNDLDQMIQTDLSETLKAMLEKDPEDYSDYPENNDYSNVSVIRAEWYAPETDWDLDAILGQHNVEIYNAARTGEEFDKTHYTKQDIKSCWVKWNTLHIEFKDGTSLESEGDYDSEVDYKRPQYERGLDAEGDVVFGKPYFW